jgi:hypothetical protein
MHNLERTILASRRNPAPIRRNLEHIHLLYMAVVSLNASLSSDIPQLYRHVQGSRREELAEWMKFNAFDI